MSIGVFRTMLIPHCHKLQVSVVVVEAVVYTENEIVHIGVGCSCFCCWFVASPRWILIGTWV